MRTYLATVKWFNGRYWKSTEMRVEASNYSTAAARASRLALKIFVPKGKRIEQLTLSLTPLKQTKMPEPDGGSPSPEQG